MNTREKILDRALEMFNERGVEYVGLRELAGLLDIRVSNITYYFPTKDDLVYELSQQLARSNSAIIVEDKNSSMITFLEMLQRVFENQHRFRSLLRSFVHIMTQNKRVLESYKNTHTVRRTTFASNIHSLVANGYLKVENDERLNFLVSAMSIINRYWLSEVAVFSTHLSREQQIRQYLLLIMNLFEPYAAAKGRKEMAVFRQRL